MFLRHFTGALWAFIWFRRVCLFLVQHDCSPAWLVIGIWTETPLGIGLHSAMLNAGHYGLAKEAAAILRKHGC